MLLVSLLPPLHVPHMHSHDANLGLPVLHFPLCKFQGSAAAALPVGLPLHLCLAAPALLCSPEGTYNTDPGLDNCLPCPAGRFANTIGSIECRVRPFMGPSHASSAGLTGCVRAC